MTTIEKIAKAVWDKSHPDFPWENKSRSRRRETVAFFADALRYLAENPSGKAIIAVNAPITSRTITNITSAYLMAIVEEKG